MSLYDRNYTRDTDIAIEASENALVNFVKQTYKFFAASRTFSEILHSANFSQVAILVKYILLMIKMANVRFSGSS